MFALLVLTPFIISAFISALAHNDRIHKYVTLGASITSLLIALMLYLNPTGIQSVTWLSAGSLILSISTITTPIHILFLLIVTIIAPLIIIYSMGFMHTPSDQRSYYFALALFTCAMVLFAIGADLITLFIAWELLGITSYLLIGFWRHRDAAINAGRKAIITMLIGDILVFSSILLLWSQFNTFSLQAIIQQIAPSNIASLALGLLILGVFTKSAQFPFTEWLADAMEGPTPISAFLHSSTMVKAGVFLIALLLPLISAYSLNYILLVFGLISVVIGALSAISETHIKRILAYSTIEDIGLMFIALGFNSIFAAMLLFFVQTFYKALLFMGAGSIMHANSDEENIYKIKGPLGHVAILIPIVIAAVSLAGIFPLSGFFGKVAVEGAAASNIIVYIILLIVDLLSSIYIFRWLFVPLQNRNKNTPSANYHSTTQLMLSAIYILAAFTILASIGSFYLAGYLGINSASFGSPLEWIAYLVIVFIGIGISYAVYYRKGVLDSKARLTLSKVAYLSKSINGSYDVLANIVLVISKVINIFDHYAYLFVKEGGYATRRFGVILKRLQNGSLNYYLLAFVFGVVFVILFVFVV